jgi:ATP-binding protein involved in chromosome partitioning
MNQPEALAILEPAATKVRDPRTGRSIWLAGLIQDAQISDDIIKYTIVCTPEHTETEISRIKQALEKNIQEIGWHGEINSTITIKNTTQTKSGKKKPITGMSGGGTKPHGGPINKQKLPGVKHIIAVASGKGGVGKSTIATNLACALAKSGNSVGLIDADVYGPSLPIMMRVSTSPIANNERQIIPVESYGVQCISMGLLVDSTEPIIWRGPMVMGAVKQFFQNVAWSNIDYLIVDLPPGTGDAQLTMIQAVEISGAIIITTPQDVAVLDAVRGVEMFVKLDVPILGIVENMSCFILPNGECVYPFGQGGGYTTSLKYSVPLLANIPLDERIRLGGDMGMPVALSDEEFTKPFLDIANQITNQLPI